MTRHFKHEFEFTSLSMFICRKNKMFHFIVYRIRPNKRICLYKRARTLRKKIKLVTVSRQQLCN